MTEKIWVEKFPLLLEIKIYSRNDLDDFDNFMNIRKIYILFYIAYNKLIDDHIIA